MRKRLQILLDVAEGLRHIHTALSRPYRHLHACKVVVDERFRAYLCDAPCDRPRLAYPLRWPCDIYQPPEALGTLLAPAFQFGGSAAEELLYDSYSYGMLCWAVLTRRDPAAAFPPGFDSDGQRIFSLCYEHLRPPLADPLLPPGAAGVISSCWQGDPALRPALKAAFFRLSGLAQTEDASQRFRENAAAAAKQGPGA